MRSETAIEPAATNFANVYLTQHQQSAMNGSCCAPALSDGHQHGLSVPLSSNKALDHLS